MIIKYLIPGRIWAEHGIWYYLHFWFYAVDGVHGVIRTGIRIIHSFLLYCLICNSFDRTERRSVSIAFIYCRTLDILIRLEVSNV